MINHLPKKDIPKWLQLIAENPEKDHSFSLENIVQDSLYYPACGLDGTPIKYLAGNVYSFIYADYDMNLGKLLSDLNEVGPSKGLAGYLPILQKEIFRQDIVPNGWFPPLLPDGNLRNLMERERQCEAFGHWSVWQRESTLTIEHGPELISLFYLGGEMSAIYQGIYSRLGVPPYILAIIQPGTMGGEWESVTEQHSFFHKVIKSNPGGNPEYLLYGGFGSKECYTHACWKEYEGKRICRLPQRHAGLWGLNTK